MAEKERNQYRVWDKSKERERERERKEQTKPGSKGPYREGER